MGGWCTTSGGTTSVQADLIDLRRTADTLDGSGDEATSLCLSVGRAAAHLPLKSALLSPGSAADVARRVFELTENGDDVSIQTRVVYARDLGIDLTANDQPMEPLPLATPSTRTKYRPGDASIRTAASMPVEE